MGWTRIEVGVNPLCLFVTRTLTRFLNECYPGCSGCMPGRLAYRSLLTLPLVYFSADSPRIETKNTRLPPFFLLEEEEEKKKQQQRSSIECWNCCSRFRSSLFFDKISLLVRRDEKNLSIFPPSFFFFLLSR